MGRFHPMELIWLFIGAVLLAGAFFAFSGWVEGRAKRSDFVDKDVDGEPDEPDGPAAGL